MKRKFTRLLAVSLSAVLALALSVPVMADVTSATVDVSPDEISVNGGYTINFQVNASLNETAPDTITITFPEDTQVPDGAIASGNFSIAASPGWYLDVWDTTPVVAAVTAAGDADDRTVIFTLGAGDEIGATAAVRIEIAAAAGISNPSEPTDTYTLTVETSEEDDAITSAAYEVESPVLPGAINIYNAEGVKVAFETDLVVAVDAVSADDFTLILGPGTYVLSGDLNLDNDGLTLTSTDGSADTTIDADGNSINIQADDVLIEDFTIDDAVNGVSITNGSDDAIVQNNAINDATIGVTVAANTTDPVIEGNVITDCEDGIVLADESNDATIESNTITGAETTGGIVLTDNNTDVTIYANTITDNDVPGIAILGSDVSDGVLIDANTITGNDPDGISLQGAGPTTLTISYNDISDNEENGIIVASWNVTSSVTQNTISGNGDAGIDNNDEDNEVNATFNWWGTADADEVDDELEGDVNGVPFLTGTSATVFSATAIGQAVTSLDAKTTVGVRVTGVEEDGGGLGADVIKVGKYAANPYTDDAVADAIAFYDVYIVLESGFATSDTSATFRFYDAAIDEYSVVSYWTGDYWSEASNQEAASGIVRVILTEDDTPLVDELDGTAFVVAAGVAPVVAETAPIVVPPAEVVVTVEAAAAAPAPVIEAAPAPEVAVTVEAPPAAKAPDVDVVVEAPPAAQITVEAAPAPSVTVEAAAPAAPTIPTYLLWVIIAIGAILVISLIVLIVRTRRVA